MREGAVPRDAAWARLRQACYGLYGHSMARLPEIVAARALLRAGDRAQPSDPEPKGPGRRPPDAGRQPR